MGVGSFDVELDIENTERLAEILSMSADFERRAKGLFLDIVFQVHKYLIRLTPADELELRGGWTSVLRKYNQDFSKQVHDVTLYDFWKEQNVTPRSRAYHFDEGAIEQGASQSFFEEQPFDITLINAVPHGAYLEFGTAKIPARHFTDLARFKGEFWFNYVFEKWFDKVAAEGKIVAPEDQSNNDIPV